MKVRLMAESGCNLRCCWWWWWWWLWLWWEEEGWGAGGGFILYRGDIQILNIQGAR